MRSFINAVMLTEAYSPEQVAEIIQDMLDAWNDDAWEVNNGQCMMFANGLARRLGPGAEVINWSRHEGDGIFPGHSWVKYNGLHYDAETPYGVADPRDMQYHKRLRALADATEDLPPDEIVRRALGHDPVYWKPRRRKRDRKH